MKDWTPKLRADVDYTKLDLSGEEGFVLSRIDGSTSLTHLTHLTGLSSSKLKKILGRLERQGALQARDETTAPATAPAHRAPSTPAPADADDFESAATDQTPALPIDATDEDDGPPAQARAEGGDPAQRGDARPATADDAPGAEHAEGDEPDAEGDEPDAEGDEPDAEDADLGDEAQRNYRKIFETRFHPLDDDERVKRARTASGADLCALCFDPNPKVVRAVLENARVGLAHARLIADHHKNAAGLTALGKRAAFLRDRQVQRLLFRNVQLPDGLLQRIMANKRMADAYQLATNRNAAEKVRRAGRAIFRKKFIQGTSEEKAALIFKCEARCLNLLIGVPLDGKTAALLCARPAHSMLLVQNLARWPSTPPNVLLHLSRQPVVKRQQALRNLLAQHPNAPSQLKRGGGRR